MADTSDLKTEMARWDGTSAQAITTIYTRHQAHPEFRDTLIAACADPDAECAATWLIKHHCETGKQDFTDSDRRRMYKRLPSFESWEAQLHILQITDVLQVPEAVAREVFDYLQRAISSERKLVRAWALYAAASLAHQYPSYKPEALSLLRDAMERGETGAVAVRLRKARALLS